MLQAGRYLDQTRPADETLLSVTRLLSESGLKRVQNHTSLKRTRMALKSILIFRGELHHRGVQNASESTQGANNAKPEQTIICISTKL